MEKTVKIDIFKLTSILSYTPNLNRGKLEYTLKILRNELEKNSYIDVYIVQSIVEKTSKDLHGKILDFLFEIGEEYEYEFKEITNLIKESVDSKNYIEHGLELIKKELSKNSFVFFMRIASNDGQYKPILSPKIIQEILEEFNFFLLRDRNEIKRICNFLKKYSEDIADNILGYLIYENIDLMNELENKQIQRIFKRWSDDLYFQIKGTEYVGKFDDFEKNEQLDMRTKFLISSLLENENLIKKYSEKFYEEYGCQPSLPKQENLSETLKNNIDKIMLKLLEDKKKSEDEILLGLQKIFVFNQNVPKVRIREIYFKYKDLIKRRLNSFSVENLNFILDEILDQKEGFSLYKNISQFENIDLSEIYSYLKKIEKAIETKKIEVNLKELIEMLLDNIVKFQDFQDLQEDSKGTGSLDLFFMIMFFYYMENLNKIDEFMTVLKKLKGVLPKATAYYLGNKLSLIYEKNIGRENWEYILSCFNREFLIGFCQGEGIGEKVLVELFKRDLMFKTYNQHEFGRFISSLVLYWTLRLYESKKIDENEFLKMKITDSLYERAFQYVVLDEKLPASLKEIIYEKILCAPGKKEKYKNKITNYYSFLNILKRGFLKKDQVEEILETFFEKSSDNFLSMDIGKSVIENLKKISNSYVIIFISSILKNYDKNFSKNFLKYILENEEIYEIEYEKVSDELDGQVKGYLVKNKLNREKVNEITKFL